ncbi:U-box domain-containing protein 11-like [Bidens hawaiensis]|uniref:U-box domain-containing protein 11-like n=1 Tax=Bidens hawaiensis TaxID=980011 RepID=UPI00404A7379
MADTGVIACICLVKDIARTSRVGFSGEFKKDCMDLSRRVVLLLNFLEEIRDLKVLDSLLFSSCFLNLMVALEDAKKLLIVSANFDRKISLDGSAKKISSQFQAITWKLEQSLANLPYDHFHISEEVQEQVDLVKDQLRRARERYSEPLNTIADKDLHHVETAIHINQQDSETKVEVTSTESLTKVIFHRSESSETSSLIPVDFLCPISLELMRDPVIVSTGQTYERSYIQRWIDCGNTTCPKTQQKLQNITLTPNYVLRSLITQWCVNHNMEQPNKSFHVASEDLKAINILIRNLSSESIEERRLALTKIRSLSKTSTDNRITLAKAGAIPVLVRLLTSEDNFTQENAVTSILNLSLYENNKGIIMLADAVPSVVQLLRLGTMETRENAAATLFSLSLTNENKIIIGASGAIPELVNLLGNGSTRGMKDAATALFNLCINQGNKGRAVRAGIIPVLLKMLSDSSMIDESLTILSVLASDQEAKTAIVKASIIPVLIDLTRTGLPRSKENAISVLLSLCERDKENLDCISRLGAVILLTELSKSGSDRAKRKAKTLLEHLQRSQQVQH